MQISQKISIGNHYTFKFHIDFLCVNNTKKFPPPFQQKQPHCVVLSSQRRNFCAQRGMEINVQQCSGMLGNVWERSGMLKKMFSRFESNLHVEVHRKNSNFATGVKQTHYFFEKKSTCNKNIFQLKYSTSPKLLPNLESAVNCQPSHRREALSAEAQLSYASKKSLKTIKNIYKRKKSKKSYFL